MRSFVCFAGNTVKFSTAAVCPPCLLPHTHKCQIKYAFSRLLTLYTTFLLDSMVCRSAGTNRCRQLSVSEWVSASAIRHITLLVIVQGILRRFWDSDILTINPHHRCTSVGLIYLLTFGFMCMDIKQPNKGSFWVLLPIVRCGNVMKYYYWRWPCLTIQQKSNS